MDLKTITEHAVVRRGQSIAPVLARRWINEVMDMLASQYDSACLRKTMTISVDSTHSDYMLPLDCIGVIKATLDGVKHSNFLIDMDCITFDVPGTHEITYIRYPDHLPLKEAGDSTIGEDVPAIHIAYHWALVAYVTAKSFLQEDIQHPNGVAYMREFYELAGGANNRLSRVKRRGNRIASPVWR